MAYGLYLHDSLGGEEAPGGVWRGRVLGMISEYVADWKARLEITPSNPVNPVKAESRG